jgi:hypothetical protein
MNPFML